jgi:glutamine phosphoribosylpyrophosphate amidotransferase
MCGVIGYYNPKPIAEDFWQLASLFEQSKIRGTHSFGFSYYDPDGLIKTCKFHKVRDLTVALTTLDPLPEILIGHNRYSTSGDWFEHKNNQPLHLGRAPEVSLAFNGVIDMREPVLWGIKDLETQNDGEIFIDRLINRKHDAPILALLKDTACSFAGVYLSELTGHVIRNSNRPAWVLRGGEGDALFIASTKDIFARAFGDDWSQRARLIPVLKLYEFAYLHQRLGEKP